MHLTTAWIVPLCVGAAGAVSLATVAALVRREVAELHRALRPLRVPDRRSPDRRSPDRRRSL